MIPELGRSQSCLAHDPADSPEGWGCTPDIRSLMKPNYQIRDQRQIDNANDLPSTYDEMVSCDHP